ncbi:unnamed protein product [Closterium sp. NIES-64]|nr:unnamed protein product [Closterium sp. NIES-64]
MSACDLRHLNNNSRNVAFQNADHLVGRFTKVVTQIEEITRGGKEIPRQQIDKLKKLEKWDDILRRQWAVRETLKYRWVVPGSDAEQQDGGTADARNGGSRCDLGFSVRISYVRDYYLNSKEEVNEFLADRSFSESWLDEIAPMNISIAVVNRGAHYRPDDRFEREVHSTLLALRNAHPDLLIIVRNTPPGHPNCLSHEKPLSEMLLDLPEGKCWNWNKFAGQNEILKRLAEGVGGVYMDVNASAVWRADGHVSQKDCLHYCHPGPVDTWVQLLFNLLQGLLRSSG